MDEAVKRIEFGYDDRGRRTNWTSYDTASGGNVVDQTTHTYLPWWELATGNMVFTVVSRISRLL